MENEGDVTRKIEGTSRLAWESLCRLYYLSQLRPDECMINATRQNSLLKLEKLMQGDS